MLPLVLSASLLEHTHTHTDKEILSPCVARLNWKVQSQLSVLNRPELKTNFFTAADWKINSFEGEIQEAMNKT
jgi:hypothetical protein